MAWGPPCSGLSPVNPLPRPRERLERYALTPTSRLGVDLPASGEAALLKALAVQPHQRFDTVQEFQDALPRPSPTPAPPPELESRLKIRPVAAAPPGQGPAIREHYWALFLAIGCSLAIGLLFLGSFLQTLRGPTTGERPLSGNASPSPLASGTYSPPSQVPRAVSPTTPPPSPAPQRTRVYLREIGAYAERIVFFEWDQKEKPKSLVYQTDFLKTDSRFIGAALLLSYARKDRRVVFPVKFEWYRDGKFLDRTPFQGSIPAGWSGSLHFKSLGRAKPGFWRPGDYRVDCYVGKTLAGTGTFQVLDF